MKRLLSATVLFVLLVLTVLALNKVDAPKAHAGAAEEHHAALESSVR